MSEEEIVTPKQPSKRLCNEIQLFDLCAKDVCNHKDGRYCTKGEILAKFESISEDEDRSPEQYLAEELEDAEGAGDFGYDEAFGVDEYGEEETDEEY
jgi:hypothetical protein